MPHGSRPFELIIETRVIYQLYGFSLAHSFLHVCPNNRERVQTSARVIHWPSIDERKIVKTELREIIMIKGTLDRTRFTLLITFVTMDYWTNGNESILFGETRLRAERNHR